MLSFAIAFGVLLHVFFWGAGLAALAAPSRYRRFWPVLALPAGFALQSLAVWLGVYAGLEGSNAYAWPSEIVPLALAALGIARRGWRQLWADVFRFGLVWALTAGSLLALIVPLALAPGGLTTVSLGSCDAADYAASARVFMEFARSDRSGFLGLTEVVSVMSANNFVDVCLWLNHFTPSALIALNGSIFDCQPHELTSVLTAVTLAAGVPVVFWMARALFGYSGAASLVMAGLYGVSPITWYSYAQVSPAPLLAALALALLTWSGVSLWRGRLSVKAALAHAGTLSIAYAIVLGSYNFILLVALVPAATYAGSRTIVTGQWARLAGWLAAMLAPLALCGVIFWSRVAGLVERFLLFRTYDFGWKIPVLTPEGWLGLVRGGDLLPWPWARWILAAAVIGVLGWAIVRGAQHKPRRLWLLGCVAGPVLLGYAYLETRGAMFGTNASYDAFKLFAVFYPVLLPAFCWWVTLRWSRRLVNWFVVAALAIVVLVGNVTACAMGIYQLARSPLHVSRELKALRQIERMPDVASVNLLLPDMWSRLWANAFLLRKPQYFSTHTYEARLNTPLRGDWDLVSALVWARPSENGVREISADFRLVDTRAAGFLRVSTGAGWYAPEQANDGTTWAWFGREAIVRVTNPHPQPIAVDVWLDGRGAEPTALAIVGPDGVHGPETAIAADRRTTPLGRVNLPPGESEVRLMALNPPAQAPGDARPLSVCVFSLELRARASER